jgi:hypothetical protein
MNIFGVSGGVSGGGIVGAIMTELERNRFKI